MLPAGEGQVFPYWQESPPTPCLQVVGLDVDGAVGLTFGDSMQYTFLVEACLGLVSDEMAQRRLDELLSTDGLSDAIDNANGAGALTKRLLDDGTVQTNQSPAADSVAVTGYRGQNRLQLTDGRTLLIATWAVTVLT